ncbi:MAG: heat-shock protein [Methanosarcinaceae archaeon]|nr:heat-shock protein [Methanosarcinaceae archaeon]
MNVKIMDNPFIEALAISGGMAIFMIGIALGIMDMISTKISPLPVAVILLIFAILFIVGSVFFEKRGADEVGSLLGGGLVSFATTFSIISFFGGLIFALNDGTTTIGWEKLISALAICMIASMLIVRFLAYKMQDQFES